MKLSIIIPAYNCSKYIEQCIEHIKNEIDDSVEIIIIDDGSKDNTLELCMKYKSDLIHVFHQENQGVSMARNKGLSLATGDYVMFVDADDRLTSGWFHRIKQFFSTDIDILYFGSSYTNQNFSKEDLIKNIFGVPMSNQIRYMASVWSKLFRRQLIIDNKIQFVKGIINGEDLLFSLECLLCARSFKIIKAPIYEYYINESSATHVFKDTFWGSNLIFLETAKDIFNKHSVSSILVDECLKYSFISSVILLCIRISFIDRRDEQKQKIQLYFNNETQDLIKKYPLSFNEYGFKTSLLYWVLSHRLYSLAIFIVKLNAKTNSNQINKYVSI